MKIGFLELLVVFVVALLVIGPDKLPAYARKFGRALQEFRKASSDITQDIRESVVDPLEEAQRPLREAIEPLEKLDRDVRAEIKGVEADLNSIGKPKPEQAQSPARKAAETAGTDSESPDQNAPAAGSTPEEPSPSEEGTETGGTP